MYQTPEHLIAASKTNMEAALRFAGVALRSVEKLVEVQLGAAKSALAESAATARAIAAAKDPQDLTTLRDRVLQPNLESAQAYARGVYDIAAAAQEEFSKLVEAQFAEMNKSVVTALDKAAKNAPAGADIAVSALRTAVASANAAFDNVSKVAKHVSEITAANVSAVTQSANGKKKAA